jgi:hypothetical protein
MYRFGLAGALLATLPIVLPAEERKLTPEERIDIIRGMTAEFATAKVLIPRSKKDLEFNANGEYDRKGWEQMAREVGPAARSGDLVQVSKVELEDEAIKLELNGGAKSKRKWWQNIEVGMGSRTTPVGQRDGALAPAGATIVLRFDKPVPPLTAPEIKKLLAPVLDFDPRTATEQAFDSLPPEMQAAVKEKRAIEGMDRDQVIMALGKPRHKQREIREGEEMEDWVYGLPPGKITFVTFKDDKVVRVKDSYAGLGGTTMPPLAPR